MAAEGEGGDQAALSCALVLEVLNTVLLSYLLTELLLSRRALREVRALLAALPAANVLLSPRVHGLLAGAAGALHPGSASAVPAPSSENSTLSAVPQEVVSTSMGAVNSSSGAAAGAAADSAAASAAGAAGTALSALVSSPVARGALRVLAAACAFAALAYHDVRRLRQRPYGPRAFFAELRAALAMVLPAVPFLVMGFSFVFLVLASLLEQLGLPEHLGEELILYGQFYSPFGAVYWTMKKDWLAAERGSTLLPMAEPSQAAGRGIGGGARRGGAAAAWGSLKAAAGRAD